MGLSRLPLGAKNRPDEDHRIWFAGGARPVGAEDLGLLDLARRLAPEHLSPLDQPAAAPDSPPTRLAPLPKAANLQPALGPGEPAIRPLRRPGLSGFGVSLSHNQPDAGALRTSSRRLTAAAPALAPVAAGLFGAALAIAIFGPFFGLKVRPPAEPEAQPAIAAHEAPAEAQLGGETVAVRGDMDAVRQNDAAQPAMLKVAGAEERTQDGDGERSGAAAAPSPLPPPAAVPAPVAPVAGTAVAAHASAATQTPAPVPQRQAAPPSSPVTGQSAPHEAPPPAAATAPTAGSKVIAVAQPAAPKLDLPAKPPRKLSTRAAAAKAHATAYAAAAETRRDPQRPQPPATSPEPQATAGADGQAPVNLVGRALGAVAGVLTPSSGDHDGAKSGDWAIQFAAPKSEAEAEAEAARLNAKYAPALSGATIAVHKTEANGETAYVLRVAGLSKADAAALCARVKGRDCAALK